MIENVHIVVMDAYENIHAVMDNAIDDAIHFFDSKFQRFLTGDAQMFEFTALKNAEDSKHLAIGNKLAFVYKDKEYMLNLVEVEDDEHYIYATATSLSLELTHEISGPFEPSEAMTFVQYFNQMVYSGDSDIVIGVNEVSDKKLKLDAWTGEASVLNRILSLATNFDAEVEFITELNNDHSLKRILMNVYKEHDDTNQGIGENREDLVLEYGKNIKTVKRKKSIENLITAITPFGNDRLTISSLEKTEYDENGEVLFFTKKGLRAIYAPQARDQFPSQLFNESEGYITKHYSYDTDNVNVLYGNALSELKKHCEPEMTYEIEGYTQELNVGDVVTIIDDGFTPTLILSARVAEQSISFDKPENNTTTFTNVVEVASQIDSGLLARMQELIEANKKYDCSITTDNGIVFKNNAGETNLTAQVKDGIKVVTSNYTIQWFKDDVALSAGATIKVKALDVADKAVYRFEAVNSEGQVIGGYEVTVMDVSDGKEGKDGRGIKSSVTTYQASSSGTVIPTGTWSSSIPSVSASNFLWSRTVITYTDNTDSNSYSVGMMGAQGIPGAAGKDGKGIKTSDVTYQASTSGTTIPTGTWLTTIPTVSADQYLWTRTTLTYTDSSNSHSYSVGKMGADGSDAQLLYLTATAEVMNFTAEDVATTAQTVTISAKLQNVTGTATFKAVPYIGNAAQAEITLGGSGNNRTLTSSQWVNKNWTLIAVTATLGSLTDTLSVVKVNNGKDGEDGIAGKDGVGVKNTVITYALSTSGTTPPTAGWTAAVPTLIKGQYLWTKSVWTYTDTTTETGYSVAYVAKDGNTGKDGIAGKDGVGIKSTKIEYAGSTSGTVKPTTGWTTAIPTVAVGSFLWTRTTWTYDDDTTELGYSVAKMGDTGPKGEDGKTSYVHYAWCNDSATGEGFTLKYPNENILLETAAFDSPWSIPLASTKTDNALSGNTSVRGSYTSGNYTELAIYPISGAKLKPDTWYGVSFYAKGIKVRTYFYPNANVKAVGSQGQSTTATDTYMDWVLNQDFQICWYKTKTPSAISGAKNFLWRLLPEYDAEIAMVKVEELKSESDTPTPYTPSPQDDPVGAYMQYVGVYADFNEAASTDPAKYTWSKLAGEPTGIVTSATEPTSKYVNMLWKNTGTSGGRVKDATYRWNGSAWELYIFVAENISATTLSAICANLGEVNAGTIRGVDIYSTTITNTYTRTDSTGTWNGTMTLVGGVFKIHETLSTNAQVYNTYTLGNGSLEMMHRPANGISSKLSLMPENLYLEFGGNGGYITAEQLAKMEWTNITLPSGITTKEGVTPQFRKIKNLDGTYSVQLRGRPGPSSGNFSSTGRSVGVLPAGYRPSRSELFMCSGSLASAVRVQIETDGNLMVSTQASNASYISLSGVTFIID